MSDKVFIDTNVWLYALIESSEAKHSKAQQCISDTKNIIISVQVINEVCVNLLRKAKKDMPYIAQFISDFSASYNVLAQTTEDLKIAAEIRAKHSISYWDSLMVASALGPGCSLLYSEDMQDGLVVNNQLTIKNPLVFK